jgi:hypothetical protein
VAAALSGFKSADSVSQLVERFHRASTRRALHRCWTRMQTHLHQYPATADAGETARFPQSGAGSKLHLVTQVAATGLAPRPAAAYRSQYHPSRLATSAGYVFGRSRTWCRTGTAVRVRHPRASSPSTIRKHRRNNA